MQGLVLGLANGTACLASCAPVILPYLLGESKSVKKNAVDLGLFMLGRFIGYLCFGVLAWLANLVFIREFEFRNELMGTAYFFLGVLLLYYNVWKRKKTCRLGSQDKMLEKYIDKSFVIYPAVFGLITGVNVCPPFLLVFAEAAASGSIYSSMMFFVTFFIGTSVYFLPFPFVGLLKRKPELKAVGEMAVYIISVFYLLKGIIMFM